MLHQEKPKAVNFKTVIMIAQGFDMTLLEFLDSDYFRYENLIID